MHYERVSSDLQQAERTISMALRSTIDSETGGIAGSDTAGNGEMPLGAGRVHPENIFTGNEHGVSHSGGR